MGNHPTLWEKNFSPGTALETSIEPFLLSETKSNRFIPSRVRSPNGSQTCANSSAREPTPPKKPFHDIKLRLSFRSTPHVLKSVDEVFSTAGNPTKPCHRTKSAPTTSLFAAEIPALSRFGPCMNPLSKTLTRIGPSRSTHRAKRTRRSSWPTTSPKLSGIGWKPVSIWKEAGARLQLAMCSSLCARGAAL